MSETSNDLVMAQLEGVDKEFALRHTRSIKVALLMKCPGASSSTARISKARPPSGTGHPALLTRRCCR